MFFGSGTLYNMWFAAMICFSLEREICGIIVVHEILYEMDLLHNAKLIHLFIHTNGMIQILNKSVEKYKLEMLAYRCISDVNNSHRFWLAC